MIIISSLYPEVAMLQLLVLTELGSELPEMLETIPGKLEMNSNSSGAERSLPIVDSRIQIQVARVD